MRALLMWKRCIVVGLALFAGSLFSMAAMAETRTKNVIIMISDGAGFNTWRATSMYEGKLGKQVYDGPKWTKLAAATYPLNRSNKPTGNNVQDPNEAYDPAKAWDTTVAAPPAKSSGHGGPAGRFASYQFLTSTATDSAAAASAMSSGSKTYDNSINWSNLDKPFTGQTIAEVAKSQGKSVGVITSVYWSHATPAGMGGAHNVSRNNYVEIANEMLNAPYLDVMMGGGHPDFNDDGQPIGAKGQAGPPKKEYKYVGGQDTWQLLKSGKHPKGWKLVETKAAFEALMTGPTPRKVVGTAQVAGPLQVNRGKSGHVTGATPEPFSYPFNKNVPTLATMTKAALNCLDDNPKGLYLMIEGGAVDWANHGNRAERMIEEQSDFLRAADAVFQWVETHSSWDETMVILTADHSTGLLWGPHSDTVAFEPIVDQGKGKIPGLKYNTSGHSNSLVPLYVRGSGSQGFEKLVCGTDSTAAAKFGFSGKYVQNTAISKAVKASITAAKPAKAAKAAKAAQPAKAVHVPTAVVCQPATPTCTP